MQFEFIESKIEFQGRAFNVRQDRLRRQDGGEMFMDVVEHRDSVVIVPLDGEGCIWFVRQYRHPIGAVLLELPAGVVQSGETAHECAGREIREEIGMAARQMDQIGSFYLVPGYSTEFMYVYMSRQMYPSPLSGDEDEFIEVEKISVERAFQMAEKGEIKDVKSLGALMLARSFIQNQV